MENHFKSIPAAGDASATREKKAVAFYSILAAVVLITGKVVIGLITGSLAILTDAIHSMLDLGGSVITFLAVRISDKPADREHHFGHGKVESLAALVQVLILLLTCGGIMYEAIGRISRGASEVNVNIWAYLVVSASILIDFSRVRALKRVAKKYGSQALAADALNFSTDIYSSLVVLFGLAAVHFGFAWADPLAAIGVALFIISAVFRMARETINVLIDRAPAETEDIIRETVGEFPEVIEIDNIRVRTDGKTVFAVLGLDVDRSLTFSRADELKKELGARLKKRLPRADITFTVRPVSRGSERVAETIRYVVSTFGLALHHLIIKDDGDGYFVSMHVEMPGHVTLEEAHSRAGDVSSRLHETIDDLKKVVIHTQPREEETLGNDDDIHNEEVIAKKIKAIVESFPGVDDCHNIILTPHKKGLALSADMRLDGNLPLDQTHHIAMNVEQKLRQQIGRLVSVTLHLEPLKQ